MREPPAGLSAAAVAEAVEAGWSLRPATAVHLPLGFGAHHWRVGSPAATVFATLDVLTATRDAASFEEAYAAAATLAEQGLDLVVAPRPTVAGGCTVPLGAGRLSCTPWLDATVVGDGPLTSDAEAATTAALLGRLHAAVPPARLPRWRSKVGPELPDRLGRLGATPWTTGPYGEQARTALLARLADVALWTADHLRLVDVARRRPWVPTHGEPHTANQLRTSTGVVLVDWESVALAPRERDLGGLVAYGWPGVDADPQMLRLFELEWRLDEITQYATWLAAPHTGTADDTIARDGLLHELAR